MICEKAGFFDDLSDCQGSLNRRDACRPQARSYGNRRLVSFGFNQLTACCSIAASRAELMQCLNKSTQLPVILSCGLRPTSFDELCTLWGVVVPWLYSSVRFSGQLICG